MQIINRMLSVTEAVTDLWQPSARLVKPSLILLLGEVHRPRKAPVFHLDENDWYVPGGNTQGLPMTRPPQEGPASLIW